ncbi:MAG TPA: radical SAM protein [Candidatus Babeliaceae bacterium]|nr:radical SAM protein [Candidatus Babeliaceae bacterium]
MSNLAIRSHVKSHIPHQVAISFHSVSPFHFVRRFSELKMQAQAPKTIDFNVNGACNLRCAWCWGPDHAATEDLTIEQWKEIAFKLQKLGTEKITFTGGEPLMKEGLEELLQYVHGDLKIRTTLSTNSILLRRMEKKILPHVDDIGLPLDGHTREINQIMRIGIPKHFDRVLEAMKVVQTVYPQIDVTIRTVVSAKNLHSVPLIGQTLINHGIDPQKLRWKLYQVTPIGIRKEDVLGGDWLITAEEFEKVVEETKQLNRSFPHISMLNSDQHVGRYFHIYPDGKSHIFMTGKDGLPGQFPLGNIGKNFDEVMKRLFSFELKGNEAR